MSDATNHIPIIDLAAYRAGEQGAREAAAARITAALETSGFFGISSHGVPDRIIAEAFAAAQDFFALPMDRKLGVKINSAHRGYMPMADQHRAESQHANLSESFLVGTELALDDPDVMAGLPLHGPNQWPEGVAALRPAMGAYHEALAKVGMLLVDLFEAALAVEPGFLRGSFGKPMAFIRALHYPPAPADLPDDQFGAAPHSDFGFATILAQDDVGGLQVQTLDGQWVDAPNLPGTLLVNVGDMLMRWTNDRFRSTAHRVINADASDRYSIPYFFDPQFRTVVACIESCQSPENPSRYEPTTWGDFLTARFDANHKYRQEAEATA
ncbi:MAG TPA: 2-oxoglutarate and iron-dependent oxygenase domain-containing protein [Alphaproteobacteria bacterium]|nr:2-oxoglutarate and iron-dependent oxygenase domain-containing protein [Alphaproteobacteria bacterium]